MLKPLSQEQLELVRNFVQSYILERGTDDVLFSATRVARRANKLASDVLWDLRNPDADLDGRVFDSLLSGLDSLLSDAQSLAKEIRDFKEANLASKD